MRALALCGAVAVLLWPGAVPAAERVEEVLALVAQERYAEARKTLDPLLREDPSGPRVRLLHGILRAREGRAGDAIAVFERLRDDYPDMFEPYNNLAVLYADQDRLEAARGALVDALERRPDAVVYVNLGDVYMRLARRAYSRARELRAEGGESDGSAGKVSTIPLPPSRPETDTPPTTPALAPDEPRVAAAVPGASDAASPRPEPPAAAPLPLHAVALSGECVRAGPFADRGAATEAAQWMQTRGARDRRDRPPAAQGGGGLLGISAGAAKPRGGRRRGRVAARQGRAGYRHRPQGRAVQRDFPRPLPRGGQHAPARRPAEGAGLLARDIHDREERHRIRGDRARRRRPRGVRRALEFPLSRTHRPLHRLPGAKLTSPAPRRDLPGRGGAV